tara:strand:- start:52 stop:1188 length:1137 start_codon:yes stop_codon:yes gene_type:complete
VLSEEQLEELSLTKNVNKNVSESVTKPNDYKPEAFVLTAWNQETGKMMDINTYCNHYSLPREDISSYKLISHTGTPYYNIVFKEQLNEVGVDLEHIRSVLNDELKRTYTHSFTSSKRDVEGVLKWADLHFGAHIENLVLTKDYNADILLDGLIDSVEEINALGFKKNHVHIHGDLIESFSGLNHINSWMSMDKDMIGANAVMFCCDLLEKALSKIDNLGEIKIVAGNHDRLSKANDEDVKGGACELIAWGLRLKGFSVEFHPYVVTHLVNGINYICLHGDKGISKRATKDIIWDYGIKGKFNFVCEAHLHSLIEKLSVTQREKYKVIRDDAIDHRRMHLQSFFTGNYYSETLGYNSNSGYSIIWDNGKGLPKHLSSCV